MKKKPYVKPIIEKETKMKFPVEIIEKANSEYSYHCKQCAACHGCR